MRAGGATVAAVDHRYAADSTSMARGSGFTGVDQQTGITFNWPIRAEKRRAGARRRRGIRHGAAAPS